MRPPPSSGDSNPARNPRPATTPARQLEALQLGFRVRLQPLLAESQSATETELRLAIADAPSAQSGEAMTNLVVVRHDALRHERDWQQRLAEAFANWPRQSSSAPRLQDYALVSEGELHSQLIGQPAIEALERRFGDVLGVIDGRLWSLSAALGGHGRPSNPFSPRAVVNAFLDTFNTRECDPVLRQCLLRQYERLCGAHLGAIYAWINAELAEGGHAMDGGSTGAALVSQPVHAGSDASWPGHEALQPRASSWRDRGGGEARHGAVRGNAMRARLRARRPPVDGFAARRDFSEKEFVSVLSLVQGNETPARPLAVQGSIGAYLRESLLAGAEDLGMPREFSAPSPAQDDAIDVIGGLFDGLRAGALLSPGAQPRLARLAWPYLRLALEHPDLFDDPAHPAIQLLTGLVEAWDANAAAGGDEAELHALADRIADTVANEYHGDALAFGRALDGLQAGREPLLRRAAISERRAWQAILGGERLQAARSDADALLAERLQARRVLPSVAAFLSDAWRQSLAHAWLREGPGSQRFAEAVAVGDDLLRIDADAAAANGGAVAEGLIAIAPQLRACHAACGLDESAATDLLARLVAEVAHPDAERVQAGFTPLARDESLPTSADDARAQDLPEIGQVLLSTHDAAAPTWLRVAWVSPLTGRHLLVTRQGARHALLSAGEMAEGLAAGRLVARPPAGPVEAVLRELAGPDAR